MDIALPAGGAASWSSPYLLSPVLQPPGSHCL